MPDDSKKTQEKRKNDPKEQRKPRNSRSQAGKVDRKIERIEETKSVPKGNPVLVPQKPPVYEDPGPEFYKSLKKETEEILKITQEESSKYKKKEIQSNWSKYEMPIESYEEIEEQDAGADYEKLIQAPLSIGGHFQFKHEKSWDVNTGPSLYDSYFEINMNNLSLAVSTIPFYERNGIEQSLFSDTDILSMNNRATKYKQKYYDDKSYVTPTTESQNKILNSLKEGLSKIKVNDIKKDQTDSMEKEEYDIIPENTVENRSEVRDDINLDFKSFDHTDVSIPEHLQQEVNDSKSIQNEVCNEKDDKILEKVSIKPPIILQEGNIPNIIQPLKEAIENQSTHSKAAMKSNDLPMIITTEVKNNETKTKDHPDTKTPVIESPEDLEKWLDDFLDG